MATTSTTRGTAPKATTTGSRLILTIGWWLVLAVQAMWTWLATVFAFFQLDNEPHTRDQYAVAIPVFALSAVIWLAVILAASVLERIPTFSRWPAGLMVAVCLWGLVDAGASVGSAPVSEFGSDGTWRLGLGAVLINPTSSLLLLVAAYAFVTSARALRSPAGRAPGRAPRA